MQNFKKILLLLLVLTPSFFFLSMAFGGNSASIEGEKLEIKGAGGLDIPLEQIKSVEMVDVLPEIRNSGSFSLGLIKKGNFVRVSDEKEVRVIKNDEQNFIHLNTNIGEVYFNLGSEEETLSLFKELQTAVAL